MRDLKMNLASLKLTSLLLCLVVGTLLIFVTGCKSSTEPEKTATLIGKIKLESETKLKSQSLTDNSGVTVALYRTAVLDTTIARINTIHPNIGVIINQETEFDHRNQAPLFTTTTNIAGEFSIASIPAGAYNAAILKNGWSVKYLYNVSLTAGLTSDVGELLVKPSISLSGYIANDYTFQADRTYLINTTTSFASPVVIETGARIYVAANESVKFYSMLTAFSSNSVEKFWKFDSSQNLYQTTGAPVDSTSYISEIDVYQGCLLNSGLIRNIRYGVNVSGGNCTISSFELRDFGSGFYFDQNVNAQLSNLSIRNGGSKGIHAMGYADSLRVEKSIFSNNYEGILINGRGVSVQDTYFINNVSAIRPQVNSGVVRYCNFWGNGHDIWLYNSICNINNNNFYYSKEYTIFPRRIIQLRNNNFFKTDYRFITIRGYDANNSIVNGDVDASQNYWAVSDIDDYIIDATDNPSYPGLECAFYIKYLPKKNSPVLTAGIRG